ncbi:MAG: rRNA maturation RNase YbeY [bacterium]|nr:rRNA maturation RNase YbeY [bacterium]
MMSIYQVDVQNDGNFAVDIARLEQAAQAVLEMQGVEQGSLTVVIEDDEAVAVLNQRYRGVDSATDVLSFPADEPPVPLDEDELPYLGDLVIAYPYALNQAQREGHGMDDSLVLLVVHGTLHLLGFDHDTPENRAVMWAAQEAALLRLGVSPDIVPALEGQSHDG